MPIPSDQRRPAGRGRRGWQKHARFVSTVRHGNGLTRHQHRNDSRHISTLGQYQTDAAIVIMRRVAVWRVIMRTVIICTVRVVGVSGDRTPSHFFAGRCAVRGARRSSGRGEGRYTAMPFERVFRAADTYTVVAAATGPQTAFISCGGL